MNEEILFSSPEQIALEQQKFISKVYGWMAAALAITGLTAWYVASSESMLQFIFGNRGVFFGLIIGQLLLVGVLLGWLNKIPIRIVTLIFVVYSVLTGITFSALFLLYTAGSLASTFLITGGMFAVMSIYGWTTGKDLTKFGSLLYMALIGLIIASVINFFMGSEMLYWITTYVGVFIFTGLIAFKTQNIKNLSGQLQEGTDDYNKSAVMGAFSLYLSFVNLFLMLLRIFGRRR
jgi:FtsH-binding integral membrane protein